MTRYLCRFEAVDGYQFDATVCIKCKEGLEENCDLVYAYPVTDTRDDGPCDYCREGE